MPDDRVSIDNLTTAPDLGSNDVLPVVHEVSGVKSTFKATLTAIGTFINKILNYSADLQTTNKTVIGAINELHNGGGGGGMSSDVVADAYDDTATYNTGDYCIYNDGLYVCDDDNVTGAWDSTKWTAIQVMSTIPTNAEMLPIESGSATDTKSYIDNLKVERQYYTATTSIYGNIALGGEFDADTKAIISATARNKANTNTVYLIDIYQNDVNKFGTTYGIHIRNILDNTSVNNTVVEGYIWLVKFT